MTEESIPEGLDVSRSGSLAIKEDPEGKLRIIAMIDYHSQMILRKIHQGIFVLLRKLPCDRTFNQDPFHCWETNNESFFSLDLSNATDRFPVRLQQKLISSIYERDDIFANN